MMKIKIFYIFIGAIFFTSCTSYSQRSPDIDDSGMGHGDNLTALGCLLSSSWEYDQFFVSAHNTIVYLGEKDTDLGGDEQYTNTEMKLVFQLKKSGKLIYWLKGEPTKVFTSGSWEANFSDSTIKIDFGENELQLKPIYAKYTTLTTTRMTIEETSFILGVYKGKKEHLKKITTSYLCHAQGLL